MTEFEAGILAGVIGTLSVILLIVLLAVGWEFRKTYWNTSLSIENWSRKRATAYETNHWRDHHRAD